MKTLALSILLVAQSLVANPASPGEPAAVDFIASPKLIIHREIAIKEGISLVALSEQVQAYFEAHDQFTLEDLKDLGITAMDGRTVKLSQIATVEVRFRKPRRKGPAEAGGGQPAIRSGSNSKGGDKLQPGSEGRSR